MEVRIDKLHIVARFNYRQTRAMFKSIQFTGGNNNYKYTKWRNKGQTYYAILYLPENLYVRRYYNVMVMMEYETLKDIPDAIKTIMRIQGVDWRIKRIDLAYDSPTPVGRSMPLITGNTKVKQAKENGKKIKGSKTYYIGSMRSRARACCYDKAKELLENHQVQYAGDLTRFEIRLKPKLSEASLYDVRWLEMLLDKFIWIPDMYALNLRKVELDILKKIVRRINFNWKGIKNKQRKALQSVIVEHKIDFWKIFNEHKVELMEWLWFAMFDLEVTG
ncbi:replication initiation factor domain-containing protein [Alicyclobacillus fodiniaquatilis]|uniref:Replication initiation factor domain-containing protein n=1 Tax=Alicyclobacillus fodiniaquatilis TaxID=1661150 RepID=A0ABW4JJJ9_9BACL